MADDTNSDPLFASEDDGSMGDGRRTRTRRGVLAFLLLALSSGIIWLLDRFLPSGYGTGFYGDGGFGE